MITDAFSHDNNTLKWINYKKMWQIYLRMNEKSIGDIFLFWKMEGDLLLAVQNSHLSVDSYLIHFKIFVCQLKTTFKEDLMSDCMFLSCHVCVSEWAHTL